jgi:hypothetical protein
MPENASAATASAVIADEAVQVFMVPLGETVHTSMALVWFGGLPGLMTV